MELLTKALMSEQGFIDRFESNPTDAVDVIIPIIHTTEFWEANLRNIYKEIPVNRLLISDGGCIDNSIEIVKKYPRVEILDHRDFKSLGFCLRKLIEEVKTDYFVYLHSDVFLVEGWFEEMNKHRGEYDWFESKQINTFLVELPFDYTGYTRPLSGGQIGRKSAFANVVKTIDDDFLYRNEDIIFAELIRRNGGKYGRAENAFLYHQIMNKKSKWRRTISRFQIDVDKSREEELREWTTQVHGLIKYLEPDDYSSFAVTEALGRLMDMSAVEMPKLRDWIESTPYGQKWLDVIDHRFGYWGRVRFRIKTLAQVTFALSKQIYIEFRALVRTIIKGR